VVGEEAEVLMADVKAKEGEEPRCCLIAQSAARTRDISQKIANTKNG
jgi:hypothetical protein